MPLALPLRHVVSDSSSKRHCCWVGLADGKFEPVVVGIGHRPPATGHRRNFGTRDQLPARQLAERNRVKLSFFEK